MEQPHPNDGVFLWTCGDPITPTSTARRAIRRERNRVQAAQVERAPQHGRDLMRSFEWAQGLHGLLFATGRWSLPGGDVTHRKGLVPGTAVELVLDETVEPPRVEVERLERALRRLFFPGTPVTISVAWRGSPSAWQVHLVVTTVAGKPRNVTRSVRGSLAAEGVPLITT